MTKRDLAVKIAGESGCSQKQTAFIIQRTLDLIAEELTAGRNVELRNFGVFEVKVFRKRIGRNPAKPENTVVIPERAVVKFQSGKILKNRVEALIR